MPRAKRYPTVADVRGRMREVAKRSGLTHEEIGVGMGLKQSVARKTVSRLLAAEGEAGPSVKTLLLFAKSVGVEPEELVRRL